MNPIEKTALAFRLTWRTQQIGYLLSRYALVEGLGSVGLEVGKRGLSWGRKKGAQPAAPLDGVFGKKLAQTFIHLGPTFIKLGQMLALRPDWIGEPVAEELRILFDRVPPIPFWRIKQILNNELGTKEVQDAFDVIEKEPLGCASLAQVHSATLKDGTPVILKVQKKGVDKIVRADLLILETLAASAHKLFPTYGIAQMFSDFQIATLREIDYREEAKNIQKFRKNYSRMFGDSSVIFPKYYPHLSSQRVITMEPLRGKKVSQLPQGSTVARQAASQSVTAILEQIFDHGFFHADPHSGNMFFMEDNGKLGFIDLGLVGQLDPKDKRKFLKVLMAILERDRAHLARAIYDLGEASPKTDFDAFNAAIGLLLDEVIKKGIDQFPLNQIVNQLLAIARKNQILIPNRYVLMLRSFLIIEGVAKSLDPKISLFRMAPPIVARSLMKSYNPLRFFRNK